MLWVEVLGLTLVRNFDERLSTTIHDDENEEEMLGVILDDRVGKAPADEPLRVEDSVQGIESHFILGFLSEIMVPQSEVT